MPPVIIPRNKSRIDSTAPGAEQRLVAIIGSGVAICICYYLTHVGIMPFNNEYVHGTVAGKIVPDKRRSVAVRPGGPVRCRSKVNHGLPRGLVGADIRVRSHIRRLCRIRVAFAAHVVPARHEVRSVHGVQR